MSKRKIFLTEVADETQTRFVSSTPYRKVSEASSDCWSHLICPSAFQLERSRLSRETSLICRQIHIFFKNIRTITDSLYENLLRGKHGSHVLFCILRFPARPEQWYNFISRVLLCDKLCKSQTFIDVFLPGKELWQISVLFGWYLPLVSDLSHSWTLACLLRVDHVQENV